MMKRTALSLLLALTLAPVQAQEWNRKRLEVKAGQGVGPLKLAERLDDAAKKFLGPASKSVPAGDASGYDLYGTGTGRNLKRGLMVRYQDLKQPDKVSSIQVRGVRAATSEGIFLGGPAALVRKKFPEAQLDNNPIEHCPEYVIPGLTMRVEKDKVTEFLVEPVTASLWRFAELRVSPGVGAGPILLGKPVSEDVFKKLGPPTYQVPPSGGENSGLIRWSVGGQNPPRLIEITLHDGKHPKVVTSVRLRGVSALTSQEVRLGDSAETVKETFPEGREGMHASMTGDTWRLPGMTFLLQGGKLTEIYLYLQPKGSRNDRN